MLLSHPQPSDEMIAWSERWVGVQHGRDRPWWFCDVPAAGKTPETYRRLCRCACVVMLRRHPCSDGSWLWLAQCEHCQAVVWTMR